MSKLNKHFIPPIGVDEAVTSLCSRTAYRCRRSVLDFCLDMGMTFQKVVNGDPQAIARLAELYGVDVLALQRNVAVRIDRKNFTWNGQEIQIGGLDRLRVRVCAFCLRDDMADEHTERAVRPYLRSTWVLSGVRTCEKHSAELVTISGNQRFALSQDFTSVVASSLEGLDKLVRSSREQCYSNAERYLVSRLAGQHTVDHWLNDARADAAVRICEMVGAAATHGARGGVRTLTSREIHSCAEHGFHLLKDEAGLTGLCDELRMDCARKNLYPTGLNVFGFLWRKYYTKSPDDGFQPLYERLRQYALENLPLGPGDEMFGTVTGVRKWHSIRTAAEEFDLSLNQARKLAISSKLLGAAETRKSQNTGLLNAHSFAEYVERIRGALSKKEAMEYLNLPRPHDQGMMKLGLLVPIVRRGDAFGHHLFEKDVLDEFLRKLLLDSSPTHEVIKGMSDIPSAAYQSFATVTEIVGLLFHRKLKHVRCLESSHGFLSVLVSSDEIISLLHEPEKRGYTALELNNVLKANSVSVRALIKHGFLRSSMQRNAKTGYVRPLVTMDDVEKFQRRYIGSFELGTVLGLQPIAVVKKCLEHQIRPAFDPKVVKSRYYLRSEIPWI